MTEAIRSLAARYYTDPQVFKLETEGLLARTWQFRCHSSELAKIGDHAPHTLAALPSVAYSPPSALPDP